MKTAGWQLCPPRILSSSRCITSVTALLYAGLCLRVPRGAVCVQVEPAVSGSGTPRSRSSEDEVAVGMGGADGAGRETETKTSWLRGRVAR